MPNSILGTMCRLGDVLIYKDRLGNVVPLDWFVNDPGLFDPNARDKLSPQSRAEFDRKTEQLRAVVARVQAAHEKRSR